VAARTLTCAVCRTPFIAARSDAETCSLACRSRRTRATAKARRERERAEIERAAAVLSALASVAALTPED
jgi:hypothetical protein